MSWHENCPDFISEKDLTIQVCGSLSVLSLMKNQLLRHTPELARLADEMETANKAVAALTKKIGIAANRSPEYKKARAAWRAYWDAVDADNAKAKV